MQNQKKIYMIIIPASGHVIPALGLAEELVKKYNTIIEFYGIEDHRELIQKTGSNFRKYSHFLKDTFAAKPLNQDKTTPIGDFFSKLIDSAYKEVPNLIKDVEEEKPDLIIYDHLCFNAKLMLKVMKKNYEKGYSQIKPPPAVLFHPTMVAKKYVNPTVKEVFRFMHFNIWFFLRIFVAFIKQIKFSLKFGIDVYNPINFIYDEQEKLNIVAIFPELQLRAEIFDSSFKFVGCSVPERIRKNEMITDQRLKELMDSFEPINPVESINSSKLINRNKLIYASLGTVFNNNVFIFDKIIDSIQILNKNQSNLFNIKLLISVGKDGYLKYKNRIKYENFQLPENVTLMPNVPQIDVLERASLFITHCGMNSTSEAIHYAVPIICLPISADQPFVAWRVTDDLKLGKMFDPLDLKADILANAIQDMLRNNSYLERMLDFSKVSRKYTASSTSAKLILEFMKDNEKKSK